MPVIDGEFVPNAPLCLAEQQVDYVALHSHILERRQVVEKAARQAARTIGLSYAELGLRPIALVYRLAGALERSLNATARYGYREAQAEVVRIRRTAEAAYAIPDAGQHARFARDVASLLVMLRERSRQSAAAVAKAVEDANPDEEDHLLRALALARAAERTLHNHVLELVGEALNMGRSAGALAMSRPPKFAMRSEQLDKSMCEPCGTLHGSIYEVDSPDYWGNMPPIGCLGGGRCRGIMVFGDGPQDVRAPEPTEEELARLREGQRRQAA